MIPVEETVRVISVLQFRQSLMAPLLRPVNGGQGLVVVGVVLVNVELVVAGNGGLSERVAPLKEEVIHDVCHRVIRVRADEFDLVVKVFAVRESRMVVWERFHGLDWKRLDH